MRKLIIGASGLVGSYLYASATAQGASVVGTYNSYPVSGLEYLNLLDPNQVEQLLARFDPQVVYLPAANPNVEWAETHPEQSAKINVDAVVALIRLLKGSRTKLVYYSSDYVFDGKRGPYVESVRPNPINVYGAFKLEVEERIQSELDDWLILRVTVVYGWEDRRKNFANRAVCQLRAGKSVQAPVDQIGNPTYAPNLADASLELVHKGATGLYHLAGNDLVSRHEFAIELAKIFKLPAHLVIPVNTENLGQKAQRPLRAGMIMDKSLKVLSTPLLGYSEGLRQMLIQEEVLGNGCE